MIYSLSLYAPILRGAQPLSDWTAQLSKTWRRSIRSRGGFWLGSGKYEGSDADKQFWFFNGLGCHLIESVGGLITWEGRVDELTLTINGRAYTRSLLPTANAIKAIYQRIGDNVLTNGSGESGAWTNLGTPTSVTQSTDNVSHGTYSVKIISNANSGAIIQSGISVTAGIPYQLRLTVKITAGTFQVQIIREDSGGVISSYIMLATGDYQAQCNIGDDSDYTGTVRLEVVALSAASTAYCDNGVFQEAPRRAETSWLTDTDSITEYGRIERVLLRPVRADAAANAEVATVLNDCAWGRTRTAEEVRFTEQGGGAQTELEIVVRGYVFTLANTTVTTGGTSTASAVITSALSGHAFVSAGVIDTNSTNFQVEERGPQTVWEVVLNATEAGDSSGNRWECGVYAGRKFNYGLAMTRVQYLDDGRRLLDASGAGIDPVFIRPGVVQMVNAPQMVSISGNTLDSPAYYRIDEVETMPDGGLILRQERRQE